MANKEKRRVENQDRRRKRVRKKIQGTDAKPRLCISRSLRFTYAQIISDQSGRVLAQASSKEVSVEGESAKSVVAAKEVGKRIAERAKAANIGNIVFDRNGFRYHGRVAAVAEGAREGGLEF